jgi:hypothetical protein
MHSEVTHLTIDELCRRCAEETEKYARRQESDPQYCFELMRRALAEDSHEAFERVYQIYERQTIVWVHSHSMFSQTGEEPEFFARAALSALYFALRGEKFLRFGSLPQVLSYLKTCVHTSIMQYLRDQRSARVASIEEAGELGAQLDMSAGVSAHELWEHICSLLPDDRSRALARMALVQDLKPRQIVAAAPSEWRDEREVSVALYRVRQILRADAQLRQLAGRPEAALANERAA